MMKTWRREGRHLILPLHNKIFYISVKKVFELCFLIKIEEMCHRFVFLKHKKYIHPKTLELLEIVNITV
jgi:hypothetical protein